MNFAISVYANKMLNRMQRECIILLYSRLVKGFESIHGYLSRYEAIMLYRLSAKLPADSIIVEIGSWKGKSTYCLAKGLKKGRVIAIDPFDASGDLASKVVYSRDMGGLLREQFLENMRRLNVIDRIEVMEGFSHQFVEEVPKIDLLFIDGDHSIEGCESDFMNYSPAVVSGGLILFHDYDRNRPSLGPTWVVENRVSPSPAYRFSGVFDSLWVCEKK